MSIVSEVNRLKDAKTAIKTAIEGKGVTVPDATMLDGMAALIESIEAGGGSAKIECYVVTIAETVTMSEKTNYEICSTNIVTPYAMGICMQSKPSVVMELVGYFGIYTKKFLSQLNSADICLFLAGYGKNYPLMYTLHEDAGQGGFNSEYSDGLIIKNGVIYWRCYSLRHVKSMQAGKTYTVLVIGE